MILPKVSQNILGHDIAKSIPKYPRPWQMEWDRRKSSHPLKLPVRKPRCRAFLAGTHWVYCCPVARFEAPQDYWSSILWYLRNRYLPSLGFEAYCNCWGFMKSYFWFHVKSWRFDEPLSSNGNSLVRKFCWSATVVITEQFPTLGGMVHVTRFLDKSRMRNLLRLPIWTRMLPMRLLDARCRTSSCCTAPDLVTISAGMGSEKSFSYK
jgi:hypothetical protein